MARYTLRVHCGPPRRGRSAEREVDMVQAHLCGSNTRAYSRRTLCARDSPRTELSAAHSLRATRRRARWTARWVPHARLSGGMSYVTVFDVAEGGFRNWPFPAAGLVFIVIALVALRLRPFSVLRGTRVAPRRTAARWYAPMAFAAIWTVVTALKLGGEYVRLRDALRSGSAQMVAGAVESFEPAPWSGHRDERFTVCGVTFSYSGSTVTSGFNQTASHGGPIRLGSCVRVHHLGNAIARLEVANESMECPPCSSSQLPPSTNSM